MDTSVFSMIIDAYRCIHIVYVCTRVYTSVEVCMHGLLSECTCTHVYPRPLPHGSPSPYSFIAGTPPPIRALPRRSWCIRPLSNPTFCCHQHCRNGGFQKLGVPQTSWLRKFPLKWMMTGGSPLLGNHQRNPKEIKKHLSM